MKQWTVSLGKFIIALIYIKLPLYLCVLCSKVFIFVVCLVRIRRQMKQWTIWRIWRQRKPVSPGIFNSHIHKTTLVPMCVLCSR